MIRLLECALTFGYYLNISQCAKLFSIHAMIAELRLRPPWKEGKHRRPFRSQSWTLQVKILPIFLLKHICLELQPLVQHICKLMFYSTRVHSSTDKHGEVPVLCILEGRRLDYNITKYSSLYCVVLNL